jgi:hypothetical protein
VSDERLQIDEHIRADSVVVRTWLRRDGERVHVEVEPGTSGALSAAALVHVVRRYARPLDDEAAAGIAGAPSLPLTGGAALHILHHHAPVDASGRHWMVLTAPGAEPIAALAAGVAAALRYLVARLEGERAAPGEPTG